MIERYGLKATNALALEMHCIQQGGRWAVNGQNYGLGLFHHFRELHRMLWPNDPEHKWTDLTLQEFTDMVEKRRRGMVGLIGPASVGKTFSAAKFALSFYFAFPGETTVLITTTTIQKLDLGIFGEIKKLFMEAKREWPDAPGVVLDYKRCITTQTVGDVRDIRNGIIGLACYKGEQWIGIGPFVGIKNKYVFLIADEASLCDISYLRATANLDKNEHFYFVPIGNPVNGEHTPLGQSCEPDLGWASVKDIEVTTIWDTKYPKGRCINFVGTDSPNFNEEGKRYPFLIDQERIDSTLQFYGPHSEEFNAMCKGVMKPGEDSRRVLTKQLCMIHKAFETATWKGVKRTKIYAVDAAYGGDRCVGGWIEFGDDADGRQIVRVEPPHVIKVGMKRGAEPEDEIAVHVRDDCMKLGIPVENIFYDSTGRGTLGAAFARVFGSVIPVPVEFGGRPSQRPVRLDLFITDAQNQRRLKRCDEEYGKRVSEFWFAVRWLVESEQLRELPESVAREFYMREWLFVAGSKRDVEPKDKTKQRIGRSPDEADWLATAVEGARQRGLQIVRLGKDKFTEAGPSWLAELNAKHAALVQSQRLKYAA
jgi:hypothetical protein